MVFQYSTTVLRNYGLGRDGGSERCARYVDQVLAVLPIEERYFGDRGISTTYVGHPFFDAVYEMKLDGEFLGVFEKDQESGKIPIGVLPGSRDHEVQRTWPILLEAIRRLHLRNPHARFWLQRIEKVMLCYVSRC